MATFPAGTQRAVLRLQAAREEDAGHYGCQALGQAGTAFDSTVLHVGCKSCCISPSAFPLLSFPAQLPSAAFRASRVSQMGGVGAWYAQEEAWRDFPALGRCRRLNKWRKTRQLLLHGDMRAWDAAGSAFSGIRQRWELTFVCLKIRVKDFCWRQKR